MYNAQECADQSREDYFKEFKIVFPADFNGKYWSEKNQ